LLSLIVHGDLDGTEIGVEDAMSYLALLLFGGLHTTTHAIAGWLLYLSSHPESRAQLEAEPSIWNRAIDEALRWTSPSSHLGRVTTKDTVIGGCPIPAGSRVMVSIGAANQDSAQFSNPREMTLDRTPNAHAAFGFGPHRCVGSHLAKLQMRVALEEWLSRYSDFALSDPGAIRYQGAEVRGLVTLPFTVTAR
jgi:cytochrome P450